MYEVFDINTDETLHTLKSAIAARRCADDLNKPHLDKLYGVRSVAVHLECTGANRFKLHIRH